RVHNLTALDSLQLAAPPVSSCGWAREAALLRPGPVRPLDLATPPPALRGLIGVHAAALPVACLLSFLDLLIVDRFVERLGCALIVAEAPRALPAVATAPAHLPRASGEAVAHFALPEGAPEGQA